MFDDSGETIWPHGICSFCFHVKVPKPSSFWITLTRLVSGCLTSYKEVRFHTLHFISLITVSQKRCWLKNLKLYQIYQFSSKWKDVEKKFLYSKKPTGLCSWACLNNIHNADGKLNYLSLSLQCKACTLSCNILNPVLWKRLYARAKSFSLTINLSVAFFY